MAREDSGPNVYEIARQLEKNWEFYTWEQGDVVDLMIDEHQGTYLVTTVVEGVEFEGLGTYSCGKLINVEDVEWKYEH